MENMICVAGSNMSIDMALQNSTFSKPIKVKDPDIAINKMVKQAIKEQVLLSKQTFKY